MSQEYAPWTRLNEEQFWEHIRFCDSYSRLPAILDMAHAVERVAWLRVFGEGWSVCDNVSEYANEIREALWMASAGNDLCHIHEMMNEEELEAFGQLPEVLTVYRGCYALNKWGFCWSLDRAVAERFPFMNRYQGEGRPLLVKATINKSRIAAIKLGRGESEIITFHRPKCLAIYTAKYRKAMRAG